MVLDSTALRGRLVWDGQHYDDVVAAIMGAEVSVWIATANLKDVHVRAHARRYQSLLAVFDRLASRGVELRMLHAGAPSRPFRDSFDRFPRLIAGGLELRQCPRVHLKLVIVDGRLAYLGSANFTGAGLGVKHTDRRNFELGFMTEDERALDELQARFEAIWTGGECKRCRLRNSGCEAPLDLGSPRHRSGIPKTIVRLRPPSSRNSS